MTDAFLGEIRLFPYNFNPTGWMKCEGQSLPTSGNAALYSLLGTTYGGTPPTTFKLPDLRGRVIVGYGVNGNYTYPSGLAGAGGQEAVTLTTSNIPTHTHIAVCSTEPGSTVNPADAMPSTVTQRAPMHPPALSRYSTTPTATVTMAPDAVGPTGSNTPVQNCQPSLAMTYCICVSGLYPQRP